LWHLDETDGNWKEMKKKSKTKDKYWNVKFNLGYNMLARSTNTHTISGLISDLFNTASL